MRVPSGATFVAKLHPIESRAVSELGDPAWLSEHRVPSQANLALEIKPVGRQLAEDVRRRVSLAGSDKWACLVLDCDVSGKSSALRLYCSPDKEAALRNLVSGEVEKRKREMLSDTRTELLSAGAFVATVSSGLVIEDLSVAAVLDVEFPEATCANALEFAEWWEKELGLGPSTLRKSRRSPKGWVATMRDAAAVARARDAYARWLEAKSLATSVESHQTFVWGRSLKVSFRKNRSESELRSLPGCTEARCLLTSVCVGDLPDFVECSHVSAVVKAVCAGCFVSVWPQPKTPGTRFAEVRAPNLAAAGKIADALRSSFGSHSVTVATKSSCGKQVNPRVDIRTRFGLTFQTCRQADEVYRRMSGDQTTRIMYDRITVNHSNLFDLGDLCRGVQERLPGIKAEFETRGKNIAFITVSDAPPSSVAQAARLLKQATQPVSLTFDLDRSPVQYYFFKELCDHGDLSSMAAQHKLEVEMDTGSRGDGEGPLRQKVHVEVYGPGKEQGALMASLNGTTFANFCSRFHELRLSPIDAAVLQSGKAGWVVVARVSEAWKGRCLVEVAQRRSSVMLKSETGPKDLAECLEQLKKELSELCNVSELDTPRCAQCDDEADMSLSLCGHWICAKCVRQRAADDQLPIVCAEQGCSHRLTVRDLSNLLGKNGMADACQNAAARYVREHPSCQVGMCPSGCGGLLSTAGPHTYELCPLCGKSGCPVCGAIEQEVHTGLTCSEFSEWKEDHVPCTESDTLGKPCPGLLSKKAGCQKCPVCKVSVCPLCHARREDDHLGRSCPDFQAWKEDQGQCPHKGCVNNRLSKRAGDQMCPFCCMRVCPCCGTVNDDLHKGRPCADYRRLSAANMMVCLQSCGGVVPRTAGYTKCTTCGAEFCTVCKTRNAPIHRGRDCEAAQRLLAEGKEPCPKSCGGVIAGKGFSKCDRCGHAVCRSCGAEGDERHEGRTCDDFLWYKEFGADVETLLRDAEVWARANWSIDMLPIDAVFPNPGLATNCPAFARFVEGYRSCNVTGIRGCLPPNGVFMWHGSSEEGIFSIAHEGWDTARRAGQAYGRGEYFGTTSSMSNGYCRGGHFMIVALTLRKGITCSSPYVVDNPVGPNAPLYSLPVLVIQFGSPSGPGPRFRAYQSTTAAAAGAADPQTLASVSENCDWKLPWRWLWRDDDGRVPYREAESRFIERMYCSWKEGRAGASQQLPDEICRRRDDRFDHYGVDFSEMKQINRRTGYKREVCRECIACGEHVWEWQNAHGAWEAYDSILQNTIIAAFNSYVAGQGSSTVTLQPPGRSETYVLDFITGFQTNNVSNTRRPIRRK
eukprot:m51a1_g2927 hypothetical protein (1315) ;mRNA; f:561781-565725